MKERKMSVKIDEEYNPEGDLILLQQEEKRLIQQMRIEKAKHNELIEAAKIAIQKIDEINIQIRMNRDKQHYINTRVLGTGKQPQKKSAKTEKPPASITGKNKKKDEKKELVH